MPIAKDQKVLSQGEGALSNDKSFWGEHFLIDETQKDWKTDKLHNIGPPICGSNNNW